MLHMRMPADGRHHWHTQPTEHSPLRAAQVSQVARALATRDEHSGPSLVPAQVHTVHVVSEQPVCTLAVVVDPGCAQ